MGKSLDLISAGHICLDITPQFSNGESADRLRPGSLSIVGPATLSTGGACANVGLSARRLGLSVAFMGKCGDDHFGQSLLAVLRKSDPQAAGAMRISAGEATSYSVVLAMPGRDRIFFHCPGANDTFTADDIDFALAAQARVFYFGYPPLMARMYADGGGELARLLGRAKSAGLTTALDMALPDPSAPAGKADWRGILKRALPEADLFLPSAEELIFMLRRDLYDRLAAGDILQHLSADVLRGLADECLALGAGVVMIKCGRHGLYVRGGSAGRIAGMGRTAPTPPGWADREVFAPAYRVDKIVSATGAGDSAVAGFLGGLLRGADLKTSADYACAAGACNVQAIDATSGVRSWRETTAMLASARVEPFVRL